MRLALILLLVPSLAVAQPAAPTASNDCATNPTPGKKCKIIDMEGVDVEGNVATGEGILIDTRGITKFSSLIRIRKEFIDEILKSANDID